MPWELKTGNGKWEQEGVWKNTVQENLLETAAAQFKTC